MKNRLIYRVVILLSFGLLTLNSFAQAQPPFRIGLNFPFVGVSNGVIANIFTNIAPLGVRGMRQMTPGDVTWAGLQPAELMPPNFTNADAVFFNTNGVMPVGTLYDISSDPDSTGLQVPWMKGGGFNFTTNELAAASNYVSTVVARYQGVTHHWEIGNEMNSKTNRNHGLPPVEFAAFLITNRNWIRATDPQASVVLPGCLGNYGFPVTNAYVWLRQILTNTGPNGFDVMNYHDYKSWWVLATNYDGYRTVLNEFGLTNLPVWVTECSSASTNNPLLPNTCVPYASEDQQAADVWRRSCLLFGKGVSTWFWHSLYSGPSGGFANHGLLTPGNATPGGQKKKSWHSFKLLAEKIEGFQSATLLQLGTCGTNNLIGGDGQWAVQFDWADGTRRYVVWSGTNLNFTLAGLDSNASPYRVTVVVPSVLTNSNEGATFAVATNVVNGTTLALTGTNLPVVVESTLSLFQIWANTKIPNAAQRGQADDPDGDGQNNYAEFLAGTEPSDANSFFKLADISREGANWRIYWSSVTNRHYSILRGASLTNFSAAITNLTATPPTNSWLDTNASNATQFYRVRLD